MSEENKAFVRRLYAEVYNKGRIELIDELYAPDVELHIAGILEDPFGPEPIKQLVTMTRTAFPSIHVTVDDLIAAEDRVAACVSFTGGFQGVGMGTSPRANLSWWRRIDVYRIQLGRVVEQWGDRDDFTMLQAPRRRCSRLQRPETRPSGVRETLETQGTSRTRYTVGVWLTRLLGRLPVS